MSNREFYFPRKTLQVSSRRFRAWRLVSLLAETTDLMFVCLSVRAVTRNPVGVKSSWKCASGKCMSLATRLNSLSLWIWLVVNNYLWTPSRSGALVKFLHDTAGKELEAYQGARTVVSTLTTCLLLLEKPVESLWWEGGLGRRKLGWYLVASLSVKILGAGESSPKYISALYFSWAVLVSRVLITWLHGSPMAWHYTAGWAAQPAWTGLTLESSLRYRGYVSSWLKGALRLCASVSFTGDCETTHWVLAAGALGTEDRKLGGFNIWHLLSPTSGD